MTKSSPTHTNRATHFKESRTQRLSEVTEDYTEMIADLLVDQGRARVCDIAREMGISHVSVLKTINRLIRDGYLLKNGQQLIELTPKGQAMADFSKKKHTILTTFLLKLGIPEDIVAIDVEGLEHHVSATTLEAIETHMRCGWEGIAKN